MSQFNFILSHKNDTKFYLFTLLILANVKQPAQNTRTRISQITINL